MLILLKRKQNTNKRMSTANSDLCRQLSKSWCFLMLIQHTNTDRCFAVRILLAAFNLLVHCTSHVLTLKLLERGQVLNALLVCVT